MKKDEEKTKVEKTKSVKSEKTETAEKTSAKEQPAKAGAYRVIYDREAAEWTIKKDGASRVIRRVKTKEEALKLAKEFSKNGDASLIVHKKDGKFQKK